jgi:hypothetical protein
MTRVISTIVLELADTLTLHKKIEYLASVGQTIQVVIRTSDFRRGDNGRDVCDYIIIYS